MNSHSEYNVVLVLVPGFDAASPMAAELRVLEACIPELMTALLDVTPDDEE